MSLEQPEPIIVDIEVLAPRSLTELQRAKVDSAIYYSVLLSGGVGAIPVPLVDFFGVTSIQLALLKQLTRLYGVEYASSSAERALAAIIGGAGPALGSMTILSWVKSIPLIGVILGGSSMVLLSSASTYAVGRVFASHFENGGSLFDFKAEAFKKQFKEDFDLGRSKFRSIILNKHAESADK